MPSLRDLLPKFGLDFAVIAVAGGLLLSFTVGLGFALSFMAAAIWMGLNIVLLGLLIIEITQLKRHGGLFAIALACAKIPAAYLLLFWLFSREYMDLGGLVAGLTTLPVVLLWRGLLEVRRYAGSGRAAQEEQA